MKKIIIGMVLIMWMVPVTLEAGWGWGMKNKDEKKEHQSEQKQESQEQKEFQKNSESKNAVEKEAATKQAAEIQRMRNKIIQQTIRDKYMNELKTKPEQNMRLTEARKNQVLASREKQPVQGKAHENFRDTKSPS